jgi:hypothetical protein
MNTKALATTVPSSIAAESKTALCVPVMRDVQASVGAGARSDAGGARERDGGGGEPAEELAAGGGRGLWHRDRWSR